MVVQRITVVVHAIGVAKPVSLMVNTFGTAKIDEAKIEALVAEHFDLRPKAIIQTLECLGVMNWLRCRLIVRVSVAFVVRTLDYRRLKAVLRCNAFSQSEQK